MSQRDLDDLATEGDSEASFEEKFAQLRARLAEEVDRTPESNDDVVAQWGAFNNAFNQFFFNSGH